MSDRPIEREIAGGGFTRRIARVAMAVIGLATFLVGVSFSRADQLPVSVLAIGMQSGMVTAVRAHTVVIDGWEYGFSPKILVLDHEGKEAELSYITRKSEVKFRVMGNEIRKIERIIVYHPE
jgi:hypothetical protein